MTPAVLRPPAEATWAAELERLRASDRGARPAGWRLSPIAVRDFIAGDPAHDITRKFVGPIAVVERIIVGLLGSRGLMLIGEPGTAKSMVSELLAAAISGDSTLTVQGSAGVTDEQIKYGWNYALLLAHGPGRDALVPAPIYRGMREGKLVRFEELTRCSQETQDALVSILSDKAMHVPELPAAEDRVLYAAPGFNVIGTANTRDRGVNEMSAALKRRFNFETIRPIAELDAEVELVMTESRRILAAAGVEAVSPRPLIAAIVTVFQELRAGRTREGTSFERPSTSMSTAEAIALLCSASQACHHFGTGALDSAVLVAHLAGTAIKDDTDDLRRVGDYFHTVVRARADDAVWRGLFDARALLGDTR